MASGGSKSVLKMANFSVFVFLSLLVFFSSTSSGEAHVSHNGKGNITIKWDIMNWTPDGYVASVNIYNFQQHQSIQVPGWTLGWTWSKKEVIWAIYGAKTEKQGDCSRFKGNIPISCKKTTSVIDLPPGAPYNMQVANCCRGGVLSSWDQDPGSALSAFLATVGAAGTTNKTVKVPQDFTFVAPGFKYACERAFIVQPSKFFIADRRRVTQAYMTWKLACKLQSHTAMIVSPAAPKTFSTLNNFGWFSPSVADIYLQLTIFTFLRLPIFTFQQHTPT